MENTEKSMDKIVALCKNRGFIFAGSDIYGGLANTWDYGPLGARMKNNVKDTWRKRFIQERKNSYEVDADILMHPRVWEASGHVASFSDPLLDCKECRVWTVKDNYRLGEDIQSKVLAFAFGLSAEIERNLISQRTKEALARKKAEGKVLGRPVGAKSGHVKLSGKEEAIREMLKNGVPKVKIARKYKVCRGTVYKFIADNGLADQTKTG